MCFCIFIHINIYLTFKFHVGTHDLFEQLDMHDNVGRSLHCHNHMVCRMLVEYGLLSVHCVKILAMKVI